MANNYTQFSFVIEDITPDEATWLKTEYAKEVADEDLYLGFELTVDGTKAYLYTEESGDVESTATFVSQFLATFRPKATVGFEWADWCSKARPGEFGGGAALVSATTVAYETTCQMLERLRVNGQEALVREGPPGGGDYVLANTASGNSVWIKVRDTAAHLVVTDEGLVVDLFTAPLDEEGNEQISDEAVGSTYAFFGEGQDDGEKVPGADPDMAEKLARSFLPTLPVDEAPELDDAFFEKALLSQPGDSLIAIAEGSVEQLRQRGWKQEDFARALKRMLPTSEGVDESEPPPGYFVSGFYPDGKWHWRRARNGVLVWQGACLTKSEAVAACWAAHRAQQPETVTAPEPTLEAQLAEAIVAHKRAFAVWLDHGNDGPVYEAAREVKRITDAVAARDGKAKS